MYITYPLFTCIFGKRYNRRIKMLKTDKTENGKNQKQIDWLGNISPNVIIIFPETKIISIVYEQNCLIDNPNGSMRHFGSVLKLRIFC